MRLVCVEPPLNDIRDDGRPIPAIIAALEATNVLVPESIKNALLSMNEPAPPTGTVHRLSYIRSGEVPNDIRSFEELWATIQHQHPHSRRPSLRAVLLFQEKMIREKRYADIVALHEPIRINGDASVIVLGREDEEGRSWIGACKVTDEPDRPLRGKVLFLLLDLSR